MRVLVVTVVHDPRDARISRRQIRALVEAGHPVTYAAAFAATGAPPPPGVRPVELPRASGRRRLAALRAATAMLRREAPLHDVVLLHDPELLVAAVAARVRTPVVWDVHEDTAAALGMKAWLPGPLRRPAAGAVRLLERLAERRFSLILAEEAYRERFGGQHHVVPNTPYVPDAVPAPGTDRAVYIGSVTEARGAYELLRTTEHLRDVGIEVIGPASGAVASALEAAQAKGRITWHGFLPNEEALTHVDGALAGLSLLRDEPNYRHSMPTKLLEYMSRGVPVITTPLPLAKDLVDKHRCGIVVPFDDPAAAATALRTLREDGRLRTDMGRRGHEAAREVYSWRAHAPAFVAYLQQIASRGAPQ